MMWPPGTAKAFSRSMDIYYRDRPRVARMDRLNAAFVRPGALAFDIGAHVGDRTASFRRLGARVVAVEPQAAMHRALRFMFGRDLDVRLERTAMGAHAGRTTLFVNSANPTVSTAAREFVEAAPSAVGWADQVWDDAVEVDVMTLDQLIERHGRPDFVKIDVEGYEAKVLQGLSQPVNALSFEFTTLQRDVAVEALAALAALGAYAFNYSLGEEHMLALGTWVTSDEIVEAVLALPETVNSGDIYAQLRHP